MRSKWIAVVTALTATTVLAAAVAQAAPKPKTHISTPTASPAPKRVKTSSPTTASSSASKTRKTSPSQTGSKGKKAPTTGTTSTTSGTHGKSKKTTAGSTTSAASTSHGKSKKSATSSTSTSSTSTSGTTGSDTTGTGSSGGTSNGDTWTPNNPVALKLSTNPNQLSRVKASLPANTDLNAATAGFKNYGQFLAAVNVSNNLGISFTDLRAATTGTTLTGQPTGTAPVSLGQAIQKLKQGVDASAAAQTAQTQADAGVVTEPAAGTSSSSKKPKK